MNANAVASTLSFEDVTAALPSGVAYLNKKLVWDSEKTLNWDNYYSEITSFAVLNLSTLKFSLYCF